jgi:hypothetical protein
MELINEQALTNTREKLRQLTELYRTNETRRGGDEELREMTMESHMRLINQLKEEIARYEARHAVSR